ncbi:hypothetical protein Efla_007476 [Eimeria flavescens]
MAATAAAAAAAALAAIAVVCYLRKRRLSRKRKDGKQRVTSSSRSTTSSSSSSSSSPIAVYIHFGSETGTAEDISEQLAAQLRASSLRLPVSVADLEDFEAASFLGTPVHSDSQTGGPIDGGGAPGGLGPQGPPMSLRILVVASHGEGEATDSAKHFESWLLKYTKWMRQLHLQAVQRGDFAAALALLKQRQAAVQQQHQEEQQQEQQQQEQRQQEQQQQEPVFLWGLFAVAGLCSSNYPSTFNAMGSRTYKAFVKACAMQQQLAELAAAAGSTSSSSKEEFVQQLLQLLPPKQPQVLGSLAVCDDTKDQEAAAQRWAEQHLLPAIYSVLQQQQTSSNSSASSGDASGGTTSKTAKPAASPAALAAEAAADAAAAAAASEEAAMEAVRSWLNQHKAPTVVRLEAPESAQLQQSSKQRPVSISSRFFFSLEPLPLLRSTNLLQQQHGAAAAAAAAAAGGEDEETECRELEFDLSAAPGLRCHTADTLYVLPRNSRDEVLWWYEALGFAKRGLALGDAIHFLEETVPFPTPCTVEDALALYCSFELPGSRGDLAVFGLMATDEEQRRQWLHLTADPAQAETFAAAIRGQGWCLRGLLAALLPSVDFAAADLGLLLLLLSKHRIPRAYTVCSSHLQQPQHRTAIRSVSICLDRHRSRRQDPQQLLQLLQQHGLRVFGDLETSFSGFHEGVCSSYLLRLRPAEEGGPERGAPRQPSQRPQVTVLCCSRPSSFKLPVNPETPLLLPSIWSAAAAAGIAPFAAFVRHLAATGGARGEVCLFYGCRDLRHFLFCDLLLSHLDASQQQQIEVQQLMLQQQQRQKQKPRVLSRLFLALSRADPQAAAAAVNALLAADDWALLLLLLRPQRKVYVQHKIEEERELAELFMFAGKLSNCCCCCCATCCCCCCCRMSGRVLRCTYSKPALGKAVQAALVSVAASRLGAEKAEAFIQRMHEARLYVEEVWE